MSLRAGKSARRRRRLLIRLAEAQDNLCFHCHLPMVLPDPATHYDHSARNGDDIASYDHLLPRSKGGQGGFNLVIAHRGCNSRRGHLIPTEAEMEKLIILNEKRKHFFTSEHGRISAGSFGEVTSSSIVLAEVLNSLEGDDAHRQRSLTCRFINSFYQNIRALDVLVNNDDWQRLVCIVRDYHLQRLFDQVCQIEPKSFVANVIQSIVKNRTDKRNQLRRYPEFFVNKTG